MNALLVGTVLAKEALCGVTTQIQILCLGEPVNAQLRDREWIFTRASRLYSCRERQSMKSAMA